MEIEKKVAKGKIKLTIRGKINDKLASLTKTNQRHK